WVAQIRTVPRRAGRASYRLTDLARLEDLCGTAERQAALAYLVRMIAASRQALWALDFPFALPIDVMGPGANCSALIDFLRAGGEDEYSVGLECLRRAKALGGPNHIRRATDIEEKAPFNPYHYRIIYQTFYGMRDVLGPLRQLGKTAILPFQYRRLPWAERVVVEACPASTLKRLGLPYQNYKQPEGGRLTAIRRRIRRAIIDGLAEHIAVGEKQRRVMKGKNGGGGLGAGGAGGGGAKGRPGPHPQVVARHPPHARQ